MRRAPHGCFRIVRRLHPRPLVRGVLADLLQFEPYGGYGITASPEVLAGEVALLPHSRAMAIALFPFRNPMTEAAACLGGITMHRLPKGHNFCRIP